MFLIITKGYDVLAVRWGCVKHLFALEPLDGRSDHLITNPTLISDVPFGCANGPSWNVHNVALHIVRCVFPSHVIQEPKPHCQPIRLALKQGVFGDAARDEEKATHLAAPLSNGLAAFWWCVILPLMGILTSIQVSMSRAGEGCRKPPRPFHSKHMRWKYQTHFKHYATIPRCSMWIRMQPPFLGSANSYAGRKCLSSTPSASATPSRPFLNEPIIPSSSLWRRSGG